MKNRLFKMLGLFIVIFAIKTLGYAQDYTQWRLPQGATLRIGKGQINDVAFTLDGNKLAIASDIGVWIYNAHTGTEISLLKVRNRGIQTANCIAIAPDNKTLAIGNWVLGGAVELWDIDKGELITVLKEKIGRVKDFKFSADGKMLACASWFRNVEYHMWEIDSGREILHFVGEQGTLFNGLALSPDAFSVASGGRDGVYLWDATKGELKHTLVPGQAWSLGFSTDSKTLVGGQTTLYSWDVESGDELTEYKGHSRNVEDIVFSPDGKTFASGDTGGNIILWKLGQPNKGIDDNPKKLTLPKVLRSITRDKKQENGNKLIEHKLTGHTLPISGLDFTAGNKKLASGCDDGTAKIWDVLTGNEILTIQGHTGAVKMLNISADGNTLYSASSDGIIRLYNFETQTEQLIHTKQPWHAWDAALSNDEKLVATGCWGEVRIWDIEKQEFYEPMKKDGNFVIAIAFSPDNKMIASGHWKGKVRFWDVANMRLHTELDGHSEDINDVAFSPDGKSFASASEDGTTHLWNLDTMQKTILPIEDSRGVEKLAFSPDSSLLITARWNGSMQIWDTKTHQYIADFINARGTVNGLVFSPDGKTLVTGYHGGLVRLWDVDTRSLRSEFNTGDADSPTHFAFSSGGKTLISGSRNGTILIWDLEKITSDH